jgi:protein-S-isoprenylcysteine O-methyltransferase Ste14
VVSGFYRYVRNPMYAGFFAILTGQVLLFGSPGLLEYTAVALCIGAAAVHFYEEPTLARRFGAEYLDYRRAVRAWVPRLHPWTPRRPPEVDRHDEAKGRPELTDMMRPKAARS